jgi:hypothetical protein
MASVTPQLNKLVSRHSLGRIQRVCGPQVPLRVITGLAVIAVGAVWALFTAAIVGGNLVPEGINPFHVAPHTTAGPSFSQYFPLFGLVFVVVGAGLIVRAGWVAQSRVGLCDRGIAIHTRHVHDAFTWAQVLTVTSRIDVRTTTYTPGGYAGAATTTTHVRRRFTVHCHDGRTFVLDSALFGRKVQNLAEVIQVNAARATQARYRGVDHRGLA